VKPLRFTHHAEVRLARRSLERAWVEATVHDPEWREPEPNEPDVERRFRRIPEAGDRASCAWSVWRPRPRYAL
jgi:hypothetical protein